ENEKENAEHLMLLDLGRNDVGKVSKYGTVKVLEKMLVEKYSHVMHLVSLVEGELSINIDAIEALKSSFPAGTVTGAPKIRAMEIINELENSSRGIYSGTIGIFDFSNNLNTCIAIRTMIIKKGKIHFQSGAGIVHDSNPDLEYEETFSKARAIMEAINFAEDGLVR
ncbi:MAG: anthranilate synthase component I family protein, partial [Candidatus Neomarinimicrobiota bacterium]